MADPVVQTEEELQVLALVKQIGLAIKANDTMPTKAEVRARMALAPNSAQTPIHTTQELTQFISDWYNVNKVASLSTTDVQEIVRTQTDILERAPTKAEIATALNLSVVNNQAQLNFTQLQVEQIVTNTLVALDIEKVTTRTDNEIATVAQLFMEQNNLNPTKEEIATALNLNVVNNQVALNFTTAQVQTVVQEYIDAHTADFEAMIRTPATDSYIENATEAYIAGGNVNPTKAEIATALALTNHTIEPKVALRVENTTALKEAELIQRYTDRISILNNQLLLQNVSRDAVYVFNKTIPISYIGWLYGNTTTPLLEPANSMVYKENIGKHFIAYANKVVTTDASFTEESALGIAIKSLCVTIDGKRIVGINSTGHIEVYDKPLDAYSLVATLNDYVYKEILIDEVGERIIGLTVDKIVVYQIDVATYTYVKKSEATTAEELQSIAMSADGIIITGVTSLGILYRFFLEIENNNLLDRGIQALKDSSGALAVLGSTTKLVSSIDGRHLVAMSNGKVTPIIGSTTDVNEWLLDTALTNGTDAIGVDTSMSYDMSKLYILDITKTKILTYTVNK